MKIWFWPLTLLGFLAGWAVASIPGALLVALLAHAGERQLGLTRGALGASSTRRNSRCSAGWPSVAGGC